MTEPNQLVFRPGPLKRLLDTFFFVVALSSLVGIVVFVVIPIAWLCVALVFTPTPIVSPLADGLNGNSTEFDRRVQQRFPIGTPVPKMVEELDRQGFGQGPDLRNTMSRHEDIPFACSVVASVHWMPDQDDRVSKLWAGLDWVCL